MSVADRDRRQTLEVVGIIMGRRIRKTTNGLLLVLNLEETRRAERP